MKKKMGELTAWVRSPVQETSGVGKTLGIDCRGEESRQGTSDVKNTLGEDQDDTQWAREAALCGVGQGRVRLQVQSVTVGAFFPSIFSFLCFRGLSLQRLRG